MAATWPMIRRTLFKQVTGLPLNGRSYTDLLAIQDGVTPITTSSASNSTSGGGFGSVPVAGHSNTGQFSINGQRESANGFYLNGASVQETIGQQPALFQTWTSIAEFRILTSNADAEYGGCSPKAFQRADYWATHTKLGIRVTRGPCGA